MKRKLLRLFVALAVVILSFPAVMPSAYAVDVTVSDDFHDTRGIESITNIMVGGGEAKLLKNIGWVSDPIVSGLVNIGWDSAPTVFEMGGTRYLISGKGAGTFTGFRWTGTGWVSDPAIVGGLGSVVGGDSAPTVFEMGGTWYLISGKWAGTFTGFRWTGTGLGWVSYPAIVSGLGIGFVEARSTPTVFEMGGTRYLISGNATGTFTGFKWTGTGWVSYPAIAGGLVGVGWNSTPTVFEMGGARYLISGNATGTFTGFKWTDALAIPMQPAPAAIASYRWQLAPTIVSGLVDVGNHSTPTVFEMGGKWYLISGNVDGLFTGFRWTGTGTLTSITYSMIVGQIVRVTADIYEVLPGDTTMVYHVSVDNGATWERIINWQTLTVTGIGHHFKWKADLNSAVPGITPVIRRVSFRVTTHPIPSGGGCFVATAAFGTPMAEEVVVLKKFRDQYMVTNELGRRFVSLYYRHSPAMAEYISNREWAKRVVRIALLPLVRIAEFIVGQ